MTCVRTLRGSREALRAGAGPLLAVLAFAAALGLFVLPGSRAATVTDADSGVSVEVTAPLSGSVLRGTMYRILGTAASATAITRVEVSTGGGSEWLEAVIDSGGGTSRAAWHLDWPLPPDDGADTYRLAIRVTGSAGTSAFPGAVVDLRVDNQAPTVVDFFIEGDARSTGSTAVTLDLSAVDGSTPIEMRFSNDGVSWGAWRPFAEETSWTLTPGDGKKTVYARLRDGVGNVTTRTVIDAIVVDRSPPTAVESSPQEGTADVSPLVRPEVVFSDDMDSASLTTESVQLWQDTDGDSVLEPASDTKVEASVSYDEQTRTVSLHPVAMLTPSTRVFTQVTAQATNDAGIALEEPIVSALEVGDAPAGQPVVVSTDPGPGAGGVSVDVELSVTFDRELTLESLVAGITLVDESTGEAVPGAVEYDSADAHTAVFKPGRPLHISTAYTLVVAGSVEDYSGTTLGSEHRVGFTTSATGLEPHGTFTTGSDVCGICHATHGSGELGTFGGPLLTTVAEVELCYTCHDGSGASTDIAAVFDPPPGSPDPQMTGHVLEDAVGAAGAGMTNRCSSCHDPHALQTDRPSLYATSVAGVDVAADDYTWCQACHNDAYSWFGPTVTTPYPYPGNGAAATKPLRDPDGYPGSGTYPGATAYNDTVNNPHNPTISTGVIWPGSGYPSGDCRNCHASHAASSAHDALVAEFRPTPDSATVIPDRTDGTYAELCLTCHDSDGPAASDVKQYVTFEPASDGREFTGGHRVVTAGGTLPVGSPLPCYDCHGPHGSRGNDGGHPNGSLISDELWSGIDASTPEGEIRFCLGCHLPWEYGYGSGEPEDAAGVLPAGQVAQIEGLDRKDPDTKLSLPRGMSAHSKANLDTPTLPCRDCHADTVSSPTATTGFNVHRPAPGDTSCVTCHSTERKGYVTTRKAASTEFERTAHHVQGVVTDQDCGVCHMEGDAATGAYDRILHADGSIDLRDPDSGLALTPFASMAAERIDANPIPTWSLVQEGLCLRCHDGDGAWSPAARVPGGTALQPFSSGGEDVSDILDAIDPAQPFDHAVRGPGVSNYASPTSVNRYQVTMEPPWNQSEGDHDMVSCFDCHVTSTGHGGDHPDSGLTDLSTPAGMDALCLTCHKASVYQQGGSGTAFARHSSTDHLSPPLGTNPDGCRSCHAGLENVSGLVDNGSPGNIHGGAFAWPSDSPTEGVDTLHFFYGGFVTGWTPQAGPGAGAPPKCYSSCHPAGRAYVVGGGPG